jgi:hypothetical protein
MYTPHIPFKHTTLFLHTGLGEEKLINSIGIFVIIFCLKHTKKVDVLSSAPELKTTGQTSHVPHENLEKDCACIDAGTDTLYLFFSIITHKAYSA